MSGGPDSLALLALAHASVAGRIAVATVDHQLRTGSSEEAQGVAALCRDLGVPADILTVEVESGNLQANARDARYAALARWAHGRHAAIATAHHADDQAETLIMRLNRGSGLSGLAGVRARSYLLGDTILLRPLLRWRKSELAAIVDTLGWSAVSDPGNTDPRFDRARVRSELAGCNWLDIESLAASARHLAEAEDDILQRCGLEMLANVTSKSEFTSYRPAAGQYIRKRVVQMIFAEWGKQVGLSQVGALVARLERGERSNVAGVLASSVEGEWRFEPEPPRRR